MLKLEEILNDARSRTETGTDYALAKRLNIQDSAIWNWRRQLRAPDTDACVALARFTGRSLDEVVDAAREARQAKKARRAALSTVATVMLVAAILSPPEAKANGLHKSDYRTQNTHMRISACGKAFSSTCPAAGSAG